MEPFLSHTIFIATHEEAECLLNTQAIARKDTTLYMLEKNVALCITGIGPYAAHTACATIANSTSHPSKWLNIGICGTLTPPPSPIGLLVEPSSFSLLSWHPAVGFSPGERLHKGQERSQTLYTSPFPFYDAASLVGKVDPLQGYIDMEGYAIQQQAITYNIPCDVVKIVSDNCSPTSRQQIRAQLPHLSSQIASYVKTWIAMSLALEHSR